LFACIIFSLPPKAAGIIEGLRLRLLGPEVAISQEEAFGERFTLITVARCRNIASGWKAAEKALPPGAGFLICPKGIEPPERLAPPDFTRYERALFARAACELAAGTIIPPYLRTAGLYDPHARHLSLPGALLRSYTSVRVRTRETARYEALAERLLEELGAPVTVSENASFDDCAIILCPDSDLPQRINPLIPVLSMRPAPGGTVFSEPAAAIRGRVPPGIDPRLLAGALFELSPCAAPLLDVASLTLNGRRIPLERAKALVGEARKVRDRAYAAAAYE
jgi:hypothetical protein